MKKYIPLKTWDDMKRFVSVVSFSLAAFFLVLGAGSAGAQSSDPVQSGSVGLTGTISSPPPTTGASISFPTNGQNFTDLPVPVRGICPTGLLIKLFKNNVFAGSAQCDNGSFLIDIDLFSGQNELVARVYDDLDQPGPDSPTVSVTFTDNRAGAGNRVSVTSNFAKRGANPGQTLVWPIIISGGTGPYAISVDWGDGKPADLLSQPFAGLVDISHIYDSPGVYNIVIKVSDNNGITAFLQLVGVANGPLSQTNTGEGADPTQIAGSTRTIVLWWPAAITIPFVFTTFWLGKKHMVKVMRKRIERGEHPFGNF